MLFYGSFFLAMGSILFALLCPAVVKEYASAFRMVDAERNHRTGQGLTEQIAEEVKTLYAGMSKREDSIFDLKRLDPDKPNLGAGATTGDQWGLGLIHIWTVSNIKRPKWRITVLLLFGAGLTLLAIPAAFTFLEVTRLLVKHLFA
jgi:hypothetical protein